jgi:eukaryotic-like serine/threonine-protein kinase
LLNRLYNWLRPSRASAPNQGHLTFGATSVGRSISRTGLLLKKQLWIWPIIAVVLLAGIGYSIRVAIERTMRASLQSQLETLLSVERQMLETWLKIQESNSESLAKMTSRCASFPRSSSQLHSLRSKRQNRCLPLMAAIYCHFARV